MSDFCPFVVMVCCAQQLSTKQPEKGACMTRINLGAKNELAFSVQSTRCQDVLENEPPQEKQTLNSNETAKREMATELLLQGFSEKAICRILNISPDQMPEPLPF
jgi:DNA-binding NarL/FixJ family response regulator